MFNLNNDWNFRSGALVLWFWEEIPVLKFVGLNPSKVYGMDIFHYFVFKNGNVCTKRGLGS